MAIDDALLRLPENRVLLGCARPFLRDKISFVSALSEVTDWNSLLERLHAHRLTLLFSHQLVGHEALLPPDMLASLQQKSEEILHQNLFLMAELQKVVGVLDAQNIRVLSFKGPSVAFIAYGSIALRGFSDIDLLISPRDVEAVVAALEMRDFREPVFKLTASIQDVKRRHGYEMLLVSRDGLTLLDVHWLIAPRYAAFPLTFEAMWRSREEVPALLRVPGLCREDLLLALSFHGLKHGWHDLEWIACVLALLFGGRENPLNWARIEKVAASGKCERILHVALRLAVDLAQSGDGAASVQNILPERIWRRLDEDKTARKLSQRVWRIILQNESQNRSHLTFWLQELTLGVWGRESFTARWKFALGLTRSFILSFERSKTLLFLLRRLQPRL